MIKLNGFKGRDLQNCEAILAVFLAQGITDIRTIQDYLNRHTASLRKQNRLMSSEARKQAREQKKKAKELIKSDPVVSTARPKPNTDTCPDCGSKDWRMNGERQKDGSIWWYEGCADCGYIQPIEVM